MSRHEIEAIASVAVDNFRFIDATEEPQLLGGGFQNTVIKLGNTVVKCFSNGQSPNDLSIKLELVGKSEGLSVARPLPDRMGELKTETPLGYMRAHRFVKGRSIGREGADYATAFRVGRDVAKLHQASRKYEAWFPDGSAFILDQDVTDKYTDDPNMADTASFVSYFNKDILTDCVGHGDIGGRNIIVLPSTGSHTLIDFDLAQPVRHDLEMMDAALNLAGVHSGKFNERSFTSFISGYKTEADSSEVIIEPESLLYYFGVSLLWWRDRCLSLVQSDEISIGQRKAYNDEVERINNQAPKDLRSITTWLKLAKEAQPRVYI